MRRGVGRRNRAPLPSLALEKNALPHEPKDQSNASRSQVVALFRRIFAENGHAFIGTYALAGGCLLLVALANAFSAWIMRDIIDEVFYRQKTELIAVISLAIAGAFLVRGLANYGQAVLLAKVGNNLIARYQRRVFGHLLKLDMGFFSSSRSGELAARLSGAIGGIRDLLSITISAIARDVVSIIGLVGVMIYMDPMLSAIALLAGPPLALAVNKIMKRVRTVTREQVLIGARLTGAFQETMQGIAVVKAYTMESGLAEHIAVLIERVEERSNKIARVSERVTPVAEILAGIAVAAVVAYGGYRATVEGQPPGSMFAFITALMLAYDPARRLARTQVALERSLVNARLIYEILDTEPRQRNVAGASDLQVQEGLIRFEKVTFSYANSVPVIENVSFTAEAGQTTAIVGASGAGKSTLVALLERFWDISSGRITVDGQDISTVTTASLRQAIAYVTQQPYMFEGSIRDNIRYGRPDASDTEVEEAARLAQADDFIRAQTDGYDTPVGENGATLSGGQRQRISIARAILRNAPILLLDEATSALDNESEARVQKALERVMKNRTTIVIAHRLSTVVNADKIVVLEAGRVVEQGKHEKLLAKPNGIYARFYKAQTDRSPELIDGGGESETAEISQNNEAAARQRAGAGE